MFPLEWKRVNVTRESFFMRVRPENLATHGISTTATVSNVAKTVVPKLYHGIQSFQVALTK